MMGAPIVRICNGYKFDTARQIRSESFSPQDARNVDSLVEQNVDKRGRAGIGDTQRWRRQMATNYRAVNESKAWSDRDLRLLRAVADQKRKEKSSGSGEDKKGQKKGK